jgi:PAS domain S-box-containing protein
MTPLWPRGDERVTASERRSVSVGWIIAAAAAAAVFVLDLLTSLGYAVPMLYVLPIFLTWLIPSWYSTALMAGSALVFTWLGTLLAPGEISSGPITNRIMASVVLLVVAALLGKHKQLVRETAAADGALRESEERLQLALKSAQMGMWDWDLLSDAVRWSEQQFRLFGIRREEFPGYGVRALDAIHPEDRPRVEGAVARARDQQEEFREEFRVVHRNGAVRWLAGIGRPMGDASGRVTRLIGVNFDITERKLAEEALGKMNAMLEQRVAERTVELVTANERFEWVTKATHDGVWDWDLLHGTVYFSPRWKEMHGFQETDELEAAEDWAVRIHPDDRTRVLARLQAYREKEQSQFWEEYRIRRTDGTYMWVLDRAVALWDEQGRAIRMVGSETDITWRKEAEEALRRREHEFRTLADNVPAFFAYVGADQRYRFVNTRYEEFLGRPDEEIIGMSMHELLGPEGYAEVQPQLDAALGGHAVSFEYRLPLPGGREHWFSAQYVPDRDEEGKVAGLFVLLADVTPLKMSEASLRQREDQLRDLSAKLLQAQEDERRRIARDLHDDFCQRLAALAMELDTLSHRGPDAEGPWSTPLAGLREGVERLTDELQQLAHRLHPSIMEDVGLEAAVREHADEFAARTGLSVEVMVRDVPQRIPSGHATCLYRVLQESLQNVRKHADATSVLIRLFRTGHGVGLCVYDDGRGFESRQAGEHRSGLGVTSMAERVGLVKGTFRIRTKLGDGTEVHAWVPLEDESGDTVGLTRDE